MVNSKTHFIEAIKGMTLTVFAPTPKGTIIDEKLNIIEEDLKKL